MKLDSLNSIMKVEDNWYSFVRVVNKINTEGFEFNKLRFLADCKNLELLVDTSDYFENFWANSQNMTLTYKQLMELVKDDSKLSNYLMTLCSGRDEEYFKKIKRLYFEEEEGSVLEGVYAATYKLQQEYIDGKRSVDLFARYCVDTLGVVCIDSDHIRFLIEVIRSLNEHPEHNWSKGIIHDISDDFKIISDYLRVHEFFEVPYMANNLVDTAKMPKSEFVGLKGYIKKGRINPNFRRDINLGISWSGCKQIIKDYVRTYTVPDGYKGYYFERPGLAYTVFVASMLGTDLVNAKQFIDNATKGCIYSCLSKAYEQLNIRQLLSCSFCNFDGIFGEQLTNWYLSCDGAGSGSIFDYYTVEVAPVMQIFVGEVLGFIEQQHISDEIYDITWIRDDSFVIIIKEGHNLVDVVSEKYEKYFKPVPKNNLSLILNDNFVK